MQIIQFGRCLIFINKIIFHSIEAAAIPASNEWKILTNYSATQGFNPYNAELILYKS